MKRLHCVRSLASVLALALLGLGVAVFPLSARAANDGQADLDKATQLKIGAQNTGDLTDVIQLCESALKKGLDKNNTAFANDLMASALVQRGSVSAAKIFGDESSPAPSLNLQNDQWKTFRAEALADLEKGLKLSPKQPEAYFVLARLYLLPGGDADKAMHSLDKTIELATDDATMRAKALLLRSSLRKTVRDRLADLDEAVRTLPGNAMLFRTRGLAQVEAQNWKEALSDLDKAIAADPNNPIAYQLKAAVLVKLKRFAEAIPVLEKAHALAAENSDLLVAEAQIYVAQSDYKAAAEALTRALAINGSNLGALELRAAVYEQLGEKAKALADIDKMLELKPQDLNLTRLRAALLADMGKYEQALNELQKLHKVNPKDSLTTLQIGMVYTTMKQYDKAIAAFDEVLARNPDDFAAIRGRADALLNMGHRGDAIAEYEKGIKLQPHDAGILNNYAWVLATAPEDKLRDGRRALVMATEACKLTEYKEDYILSTLAAACAETGDFESARKYAAQAVEAKPSPNAESSRKDELQKELDSYKANKPWREALPDDAKPAAEKNNAKAAGGDSTEQKDKKTPDKPKKKKKKKKPAPPPEDQDSPADKS